MGMARRERYLVGLDVGTSKVAAIVGELMDDGGLDIIGIGLAESKGIRRGVVNNVDSAADAIKRALDEAELTAGIEIDSVYLALSGAHVKAFNSRGVVESTAFSTVNSWNVALPAPAPPVALPIVVAFSAPKLKDSISIAPGNSRSAVSPTIGSPAPAAGVTFRK